MVKGKRKPCLRGGDGSEYSLLEARMCLFTERNGRLLQKCEVFDIIHSFVLAMPSNAESDGLYKSW